MRSLFLLILPLAALVPGCGSARPPSTLEQRQDPARRETLDAQDAELIRQARQLLADDRPAEAQSLLTPWLETPGNRKSPYIAEALYLRGNARAAQGEEYDALYDYEDVAKNFPGSDVFPLVLERELDVAMLYLRGRSLRFAGLRIDFDGRGNGAISIAEEIILRVNERMPGSKLAEKALLALGDYYYERRDLPMAAETYDVFLEAFPRSPERSRVMQRRAFANIAQYKGPRHDASGLVDAKYQVEQFQREFPIDAERVGMSDALKARLDESAAEQLLVTGRWYLDRDQQAAARYVLSRLVYTYPGTGATRDALAVFEKNKWPLPGSEPLPPGGAAPGPAPAGEVPQTTGTAGSPP